MSADFKGNVVNDQGIVQSTSTVTVKDVNGALIPAGELFSDAALTIPFAANPFTTDAQGSMNFFIEPQTVNITAQKGVFIEEWEDVVLNEQIDSDEFATAAQGALADSALQAGAGGLLQDGGLQIISDIDDLTLTTSLAVTFTNSTTGTKPSFTSGSMLSIKRVSAVGVEQLQQLAWPDNQAGNMAVRTASGGVFGAWREVWTTGNYQPETSFGLGTKYNMVNNSGGAIADQATISGANLTNSNGGAVATGTWRNTSKSSCADTATADFTRID